MRSAFNKLMMLAMTCGAFDAYAADAPVIQPDIERRDVKVPKIDVEDFELGVFLGLLSVEDFGSNPSYGLRAAYHVSEDVFVEGVYGMSTVSDISFRRLGIAVFPREEEDWIFYNFSVGYNFFPGEVFLSRNWAMSSAVYVIAGIGGTEFIDERNFTFHYGVGMRVLPTDWLALHFGMRDYVFESDLLGYSKMTHNFETQLGIAVFF